jgi:hypothetical protein
MSELRKDTIGELFKNLLQHLKCIEIRLDFAKAVTSHKQKYAINHALIKTKAAINHICDLLGDSEQVLKVKSDLDKVDMVYVMVLTEQLFSLPTEAMEEITDIIDKYLIEKYGSEPEHKQM